MARNNISLSIDDLPGGRFKVRWREDVVEDGKRVRKARSQVVSDKGARDALVAKIRRSLESGVVYEPEARTVASVASLDVASLGWLQWQKSRKRAPGTLKNYVARIKRLMASIRAVRRIANDAPIPVSVLSIALFAELRNRWAAEDGEEGGRRACAAVRYHLSGHLLQVWRFAASQPGDYPGVPAPPEDHSLALPPAPALTGPPEAPTWEECDRVIARAYAVSRDLGDLLVGERMTGLRVEQVAAIRRSDVDVAHALLTVRSGKTRHEKAAQRTVPIPSALLDAWSERIAARLDPNAFLFEFPRHERGTTKHGTGKVHAVWEAATLAAEVRRHVWAPLRRRVARPNHAMRAAYIAGLESMTVKVGALDVRVVDDKTIKFLVGHSNNRETKDAYYSPAQARALRAAVDLVPPVGGPYPGDSDAERERLTEAAPDLPANVIRLRVPGTVSPV